MKEGVLIHGERKQTKKKQVEKENRNGRIEAKKGK